MEDDPFAMFEIPAKRLPEQQINDSGPRKMANIEAEDDNNQFPQNIMQELNQINNLDIQQIDDDFQQDENIKKKRLQDIQIQKQRYDQGCMHEIYYPLGYQRKIYQGQFKAKKYPFKLDHFQAKAIRSIQSDQSVLVCAHTSAGKTAVAEYAIAHSLNNNSRVIYTSPIKALSNQKYRELKQQFKDVGLITGDVAIDQSSTCLVMTTQILRNMIYKGSQIVRQVKWVIFDEVHYMRDKQRGVVWEQTIIMLPSNVKYVFLSATIGNPGQFAQWITKLRKQPCNVVYTDYRPVPLEHYMCPSGGQGLFLVVDDNGKFRQQNFNKALNALTDSSTPIGLDKKKKNVSQGSDLSKIIKTIMQKALDPVIVFSFSKKDVESYAKSICSKYDLTTAIQKQRIQLVFNRSLEVLEQKDRKLPPILAMRQILKKGVGIHHGGLLPLLKEVVQLLFQDGLLKVLFSTQTFSMGLNMPARTVVFTSLKKFDGQKSRWVTGGQYIQMSGRAGRRGLDKKGTTILMLDEKLQPEIAKNMLKGKSDDLLSSFYINYHMLLNSQRLQDIDVEFILARSLLQFQQDAKLPMLKQQYAEKHESLKNSQFQNQRQLQSLLLFKKTHNQLSMALRKLVFTPQRILPFLNIGRVVKLLDGQIDWGYGLSINFHRKQSRKGKQDSIDGPQVHVDVMVHVKKKQQGQTVTPIGYNQEGQMVILTFSASCIIQISSLKLSNLPSDLTSQSTKTSILKTMKNITSKPVPQLSIDTNDVQVLKLRKQIQKIQQQIKKLNHLQAQASQYKKIQQQHQKLRQLSKKIKVASALVLSQQMKAHNRVMKRAGLVQKNVITLKGRVTCQINSNHQILLTQLIFTGFFNDMTPIQAAALLSSLVHQQKSSTQRSKTKIPRLRQKLQQLIQRAKKLFQIFKQCKMAVSEEDYIDTIKQQMVQITHDWCQGCDFEAVCKKTDSYQGSIIRTWRRLHELLKDLSTASKQIGNQTLSQKFEEASLKVNRGIVVSASLYVL